MPNRRIIYRIAGWAGLNHLSRSVFSKSLLVLAYHGVCGEKPDIPDPDGLHVPESLFESQVDFLINNYTPVSYNRVREYYISGAELPEKAILISFDDGYRNVMRHGLPVLRRKGISCILFPVPGLVESGGWLWTSELEFQRGLDPDFVRLRDWLKGLSSDERRKWIERELDDDISRPECEHTLMSWEELTDISKDPLVEIGSHGLSHDPLTGCNDAQLEAELAESRMLLQNHLGKEITAICYPNGNFSQAIINAAGNAGYALGFTTVPRHASRDDDPMAIPRILVGRTDTPTVLAARLAGWQEWVRSASR